MIFTTKEKHVIVVCLTFVLAACGASTSSQVSGNVTERVTEKQSSFGVYEGYDPILYTEFTRESVYIPMRDGIRLAADIYRPAKGGMATETPHPVLMAYSVYRRVRKRKNGKLWSMLGVGEIDPATNVGSLEYGDGENVYNAIIKDLVARGYVVMVAVARGSGASFGINTGEMSGVMIKDGHDLVEWAASQSFSSGKVGMYGLSYYGITQYGTASSAPPSLAAIFPEVGYLDPYAIWNGRGGITLKSGLSWGIREADNSGTLGDDESQTAFDGLVPVDADRDGALLKQALAERTQSTDNIYGSDPYGTLVNWIAPNLTTVMDTIDHIPGFESRKAQLETMTNAKALIKTLKGRSDVAEKLRNVSLARELVGPTVYRENEGNDIYVLLSQIQQSGIPAYHWGGWRDGYTTDTLTLFANWTAPSRVTIGPWTHSQTVDPRDREGHRIRGIEYRRWFDYWLKGIDNGVLDEPAVSYSVVRDPRADEKNGPPVKDFDWRFAASLPIQNTEEWLLYLSDVSSGSIPSVNDGSLTSQPQKDESLVSFDVDYLSTTGTKTRYYDTIGFGPIDYPDLKAHAATALTFTSRTLEKPIEIVGYPVVSITVSSTEADGEFNFYLEEVDADGEVHFLTDGVARASYAETGEPPFDNFGLPWFPALQENVDTAVPLNEKPMRLDLALQPIANHFEKGSRIRLVITGADADNNFTIPYNPAPTQSVALGGITPAFIKLPILIENN